MGDEDDDVLPARLQRLEIDRRSRSCPYIPTDKFDQIRMNLNNMKKYAIDGYYCITLRKSSRPNIFSISPKGIKSTTNFKPSKNERTKVERTRRNTILREAILKLNAPGTSGSSDNTRVDTLFENTCRLSIPSKIPKLIDHHAVMKDLKSLRISKDCRQAKDDTSIQDDDCDVAVGTFQRARSNTMPNLKRGPGPGGGDQGAITSNSNGQSDGGGASGQQQLSSSSNTCSIQARISPPSSSDVTIGELAAYFEEFVHIPRKMSPMAEMMYT